jgi:hypothetical protein
MATGYELIYDIRGRLGLNSDDSRFSNEYILFQVEKARAALIKRNFGKSYRQIPSSLIQPIEMELEMVSDNDFSNLDAIIQTVDPLPTLIESAVLNMNMAFDGGSYTDLKFILVDKERFPYVGKERYFPNLIYCTIGYDYRLKFKSQFNKYRLLSKVRGGVIAMHPEDAWKYHPDYDTNVDFLTQEYPLDSETLFELSNIITNQLAPTLGIPLDKINNADEK